MDARGAFRFRRIEHFASAWTRVPANARRMTSGTRHTICASPAPSVPRGCYLIRMVAPDYGFIYFAAQYPARTILYRRLRHDVAAAPPRLEVGSGRYCLTVWLLHLPAGRQVHYSPSVTGATPQIYYRYIMIYYMICYIDIYDIDIRIYGYTKKNTFRA